MKALFTGLGSIGQRHLRNFRAVVGKDAEVIVYRQTAHNVLVEDHSAGRVENLKSYYQFREVEKLDEALEEKPDAVFITNPSFKHIVVALKAASHGCALFIEKPLSHSLDGIQELEKEVKRKGLVTMIGYQTRFHPCYESICEALLEKKYGRVISASFEWGTCLPLHHTYEDYRKGYAALKQLGGGVVLGLIHEIDLIYSFWGVPAELFSIGGKISLLEMDAEDTVSVLMGFKQKRRNFPVTLFLSYAQTTEHRKIRIQFDEATLFCDLTNNTFEVYGKRGEMIVERGYPDLKRNDLFMDEMIEFIDAVREKRQSSIPLSVGIETLKIAMRIKNKMKEVRY